MFCLCAAAAADPLAPLPHLASCSAEIAAAVRAADAVEVVEAVESAAAVEVAEEAVEAVETVEAAVLEPQQEAAPPSAAADASHRWIGEELPTGEILFRDLSSCCGYCKGEQPDGSILFKF